MARYGKPRNPGRSSRRRLLEWIAVALAVVTVIGISTMMAVVWRSPGEIIASASMRP